MESNATQVRAGLLSVWRKPVNRSTCRHVLRFPTILLLTAGPAFAQPLFTDATNEAGVSLFHSRSISFGDYDNDGRADLFHTENGRERRIALLHNEGDGSFADHTSTVQAHIPLEKRKGGGSIFGDYDNDGDLDLFVPIGSDHAEDQGRNVLLRNDRGSFAAVTHEAGLIDSLPTDNAIWFDYDRDGFLDLYIANPGWHRTPELRDPTPRNLLYRNNGDGTFIDQTAAAGLDMQLHPEWGGSIGGLAGADFNDDGWPDLYVGNHSAPNRLFLSDGQGGFRDVTAGDIADEGEAFGLAVGDIDNDGDLDIFQAAGGGAGGVRSLMLLNLGDGEFLDVTEGIGLSSLNNESHGNPGLADLDNDGDLDLLIIEPLRLFLNRGDGTFAEQTDLTGITESTRGFLYLSIGDYTGDGFLDVATGIGLSRNNGNTNHFLRVELVGVESNRNGIGSRVTAVAGDLVQTRQILGGLGYNQEELLAHFGLGPRTRVDRLEIRWPSGQVSVLEGLPVDRKIRVIEGQADYHIVQPTSFEKPPPAGFAAGSTTDLVVQVRPALFETKARVLSVTTDLSAFGGSEAVSLTELGNGTYQLETVLEVDDRRGLRDLSFTIEQNTSLGRHWTRLSKTIAVAPPIDLGLFEDATASGWSLDRQWVTNLTQNSALDAATWWSPDGTKIGLVTDRDGNGEVYLMNADGSNPVNLTNFGANDSFPSWSSDETKIVFQSDRDGNSEIYSMSADGTDLVRLTDHPANESQPRWSPDGSKILFQTDRDGNSEIYVMNADGSDPTNLTNHPAVEIEASWSPDGSKIVFDSTRDGGNLQLYVMNTDGSNQFRLVSHSEYHGFPHWSPDGRKIAFTSTREANNSELYVMDADGTNIVRMTHNPIWDGFPRWGPDMRKIAFLSYRDGNGEIYILDLDADQVVLNPDERRVVFEGETSLQVQTSAGKAGEFWKVLYRAQERVDLVGYRTLRFAIHPGDVDLTDQSTFRVALGESQIDLLDPTLLGGGIDLDARAWQVVELPLSMFEVEAPIDGIVFSGNLAGTFYLDDLRLLTIVETSRPTAVEEDESATPRTFSLGQNYPNPFNSGTVIRFELPEAGETKLTVYNLVGQVVASIVDGTRDAGAYTVRWDGRDEDGRSLATGVYIYRMQSGNDVETRKLLLLR